MIIKGLVCIYKITNPNGKIYIGQTLNIMVRLATYRRGKFKSQPLLHRSVKKYGWENHKVEILTFCEEIDCNKNEIYYIEEFKSYYKKFPEIGLNLTLGGRGSIVNFGKGHFRAVLQYSLSGKFIREWESLKQVQDEIGINYVGIYSCCRFHKNYPHAGGFIWRYKESDNYPKDISSVENAIRKKFEFGFCKIKSTSLIDGTETIYNNIKECALIINLHWSQIYRILTTDHKISKSKQLKFELVQMVNNISISQETDSTT